MDVVNYEVRERLRNGTPDAYRGLFENLVTDKNGDINLDYSEILRSQISSLLRVMYVSNVAIG